MASSDNGKTQSTRVEFEHFDVAPLASDHYYITHNLKSRKQFNDGNSSLFVHIMKEWKILKRNLPDSIYVQVYETRIDLLRAVIIGSPGTPYHDGLFFFDILLPSDYPNNPPKVHYHSHGYRLNPNLYDNGKVCLSLINTWHGSKTEKWRQESTILQVLVSIQGLVLTDKPYFNEPSYENVKHSRSPKWVKGSNDYNENVFVYSCWSMLHLIQKPPKNFEGFVAQHFCERAECILAAVKAYGRGHIPIGEFQVRADAGELCSENMVSEKFKTNLARIEQHLRRNFERLMRSKKQRDKYNRAGAVEERGNASAAGGNSSLKSRGQGCKEKVGGQHKNWFAKSVFGCFKWCEK